MGHRASAGEHDDRGAADVVRAAFISRANRFVVVAARRDGEEVRAYLPNTARLTDLLVPGAPVLLEHNTLASRRTRWTVTRVWDGTWVALVATTAADLVAERLGTGDPLVGWPRIREVRREVTRGRHRFDLEVDREDGRTAVIEVKSLSRVVDGVAPLSATPSTRGVAHLEALAGLAATGTPVATVFVVQRADAVALDVSAPADPAWVAAVRHARANGVEVHAYACEVGERDLRLGPAIPVVDAEP